MIEAVISILGIPVGYILGHIAHEEIISSKRYIQCIKQIFFVLVGGYSSYYLFTLGNEFYSGVLFFLTIIVLIATFKTKKRLLDIPVYLLLVVLAIVLQNLLVVSLLFMYGLPLGIQLHDTKRS
jgi:hypothetical protein